MIKRRKLQVPFSVVVSKLQGHYMNRCIELGKKALLLDLERLSGKNLRNVKKDIQQCHRDFRALYKKAMIA